MIRPSPLLTRFERDYARSRDRTTTFEAAARVFEGLWDEARALNPAFPGDWATDLTADLAVARAVNGLPPDA